MSIGIRIDGGNVVIDFFDLGKSVGFTPEQAVDFSAAIDEAVGKLMQRDIEVEPDSAGALQ